VWLDVAKDYQQQAILAALEELIREGDLALILPRTVVDEFARNKARVVEDSSRSLSSTLKRAKEAVSGGPIVSKRRLLPRARSPRRIF
jgi:hypothetical protein